MDKETKKEFEKIGKEFGRINKEFEDLMARVKYLGQKLKIESGK